MRGGGIITEKDAAYEAKNALVKGSFKSFEVISMRAEFRGSR
jgi:hypothetical protein